MKFDMGAVLVHYGAAPTTPRQGWAPVKCPFHEDKHPSAAVDGTTGRFHCFVCGIHEDAIGLIMERDNVDFQEAVRIAEEITGQSAESLCEGSELGGWFPRRKGHRPGHRDNVGAWRRGLTDAWT